MRRRGAARSIRTGSSDRDVNANADIHTQDGRSESEYIAEHGRSFDVRNTYDLQKALEGRFILPTAEL